MTTHDSEMLLDAVARLTAGLVEDAQTEDLARLRQAAATALRLDLARGRELPSAGRFASGLSIGVDDDLRAAVAADLRRVDERDETPLPVVAISRDYALERLLSSDLSGPTRALTVGERRGPFVLPGDDEMWFDLFFAAEHLEVGEVGASAPALVLTSAQPPAAGGDPLFELKAGTVWIRGDLVAGSLPTGAYVGIVIDAGTLRVRGPVSMTGDTITVPGTLHAELKLRLAERDPEPIDAGCDSAQASVTLPDALSCVIDAGAAQLAAAPGEATAWGQTFSFSSSTGSWRFVAPQWTVVLDCEVDGDRFDADAIPSALCTFEGPAKIRASGLGLPVVVVDPDALGEATRGAGWWLLLESLGARWYDADPRPHALLDAWVGISGQGAIIRADEATARRSRSPVREPHWPSLTTPTTA